MTAPNDEVVYDPQKGPVMSIIQRVCLDADEKPITELYIATDTKTYWLDESTGSWEETQIIYDQTQGRFDYVNYSVGDTYYTILANGCEEVGVWDGGGYCERVLDLRRYFLAFVSIMSEFGALGIQRTISGFGIPRPMRPTTGLGRVPAAWTYTVPPQQKRWPSEAYLMRL